MLKKYSQLFLSALVISDSLVILASWIGAYYLRFYSGWIPYYMLRLKMKAGITGWAQVNGWRGNTCLEKRIEHDLYYIKHWSLLFDIKILIKTLWNGLINRHAY
jgi:lipopolysaccharide/colanic/teichoic acid biosynthesis glycosyltransferase